MADPHLPGPRRRRLRGGPMRLQVLYLTGQSDPRSLRALPGPDRLSRRAARAGRREGPAQLPLRRLVGAVPEGADLARQPAPPRALRPDPAADDGLGRAPPRGRGGAAAPGRPHPGPGRLDRARPARTPGPGPGRPRPAHRRRVRRRRDPSAAVPDHPGGEQQRPPGAVVAARPGGPLRAPRLPRLPRVSRRCATARPSRLAEEAA
ncbi:hypothetical protein G5V59_13435 [Nocardioides sp. W3-2-3]|uniref:hypothetical protein n=1 Tax=Nocardioides convexus TaxID=2712224 RepID=UPI0024186C4A|nr:hypothetical protein [Nocardioides convexus]NHA00678.1 hypothetical protein [Nocardioides convexus]